MGETLDGRVPKAIYEASAAVNDNKVSDKSLVVFPRRNNFLSSLGRVRSSDVGHEAVFLVKVAAVEAFRRFSRNKCPFAWRGLQALQILCCPPFKWIQRWAPFKGLVTGMQMLLRPLLVVSIATALSDCLTVSARASHDIHDSCDSEANIEQATADPPSVTRPSDVALPTSEFERWVIRLHKELENQGITLPERINEDELFRFYTAARNDFACFLASIKKTIHWRETYRILSREELKMWSNMVFWHGYDVFDRPCLIVRVGLASSRLAPQDKPRFAQAIISQVEHGVFHLVNANKPQITVLVDCEGLSPLQIPMQVLKSCAFMLQDHFPYRLGCLFVIRLPAVVRVLTLTFLQALRPGTRKKVKIEGEMYQDVLSEYLQKLPAYLGGDCTCCKCSNADTYNIRQLPATRTATTNSEIDIDDEDIPVYNLPDDTDFLLSCQRMMRSAMIIILMLWILIAFISGIFYPESWPYPPPQDTM